MSQHIITPCPISDVPDAPGKPDVANIDTSSIHLEWTPPRHDGGSPITGYVIEKRDTVSERWMKVTKAPLKELNFTVGDLIENTQYQFRVSAENKAGLGEPSEPSQIIKAKLPFGKLGRSRFGARYMYDGLV